MLKKIMRIFRRLHLGKNDKSKYIFFRSLINLFREASEVAAKIARVKRLPFERASRIGSKDSRRIET
jgi:hypothetical protein